MMGAQIIELTFGYKVESREDRYLDIAEKAMDSARVVMKAGAYLVDLFPPRMFFATFIYL